MSATQTQLDELEAVNRSVNKIPYVADNLTFGELPDTWKVSPDGKGFLCRDYVLAKAEELVDKGWLPSDLSVVLCYTEPVPGYPDGEYHAVLWVEAGGESWVLDNRFNEIYRWDQPLAAYRWALRQVAGTDEFLDISAA